MYDFQEQFCQVMTRLRANQRSRTASTSTTPTRVPIDDVRETEITNGLLVSRPAIKKEPEVIDLQEYAKSRAGSISGYGINKIKAINDFITVVK